MYRPLVGLMSVLTVLCTVVVGFAPAAAAQDYVPISGSGSTWSFNAIDQWRKNVQQFGIKVNFSGTGSTDGRNQFYYGQVDFAVSEIPYGEKDRNTIEKSPPEGSFAYMPIVAGGTSLMYNLNIGGKRITNLRLSGEVVTKIFTGGITNWSDPAIKADNPNLALPARKIVPVVRSDGSGSTAQFTAWMAAQHAPIWDAYCARAGRSTPCGLTSSYPVLEPLVAQDKSIGVANYVRQAQSEGAITYVEYSYAKNAGFPVAKLLNAKGYYVAPTASAVAVALLRAKVRPNLTQDLSQVYADPDPRTYPLSSYSYMIIPTVPSAKFSSAKGRTLADFGYYFLCEGQQQAERLGFSPLPINLVRAGLDQVARIPGSVKKATDISKCNNPTFSADGTNTLAVTAKQPPECDRRGGPAQCTEAGVPVKAPTKAGGPAAGGPAVPGEAVPGEAAGPAAEVADEATGGDRAAAASASAVPVSVDLPQDDGTLLVVVAVVLLVALVVGPPMVARLLRKSGAQR
ncbi:phosphate ABC transporter substrate-binding protein, PhoT family [Actinokineospora alba]|uniref:Phosphate ABC transporter substrate-binding protein, PhoT family n=1 Tax=Actinokineospora alba TaxID=504798 RepID=A0A1H0M4G4_9PSEU|nr:phosphate ABC transporter substrate-binding protein PstS [Actinokineospora alba]TDP67581.1 phosphate ABC transporter substrate-binding protein (PhoT family) [Actinokineospora alba]SDI45071.1 phosphate transport system substrate-binding protein [Actinokineospora alba]SDO75265.1 phosphate ABC transporter substrate-binding protein, PhoT family [Actinokineospora alba]